MRRILVDVARTRQKQKRGGAIEHVPFEDALAAADEHSAEVIAVDEALRALAAIDERKSKVVELRYFGGLTVEETAAVLKVAPVTVMRDWRLARAWLLRELDGRR